MTETWWGEEVPSSGMQFTSGWGGKEWEKVVGGEEDREVEQGSEETLMLLSASLDRAASLLFFGTLPTQF